MIGLTTHSSLIHQRSFNFLVSATASRATASGQEVWKREIKAILSN